MMSVFVCCVVVLCDVVLVLSDVFVCLVLLFYDSVLLLYVLRGCVLCCVCF